MKFAPPSFGINDSMNAMGYSPFQLKYSSLVVQQCRVGDDDDDDGRLFTQEYKTIRSRGLVYHGTLQHQHSYNIYIIEF